MLSDPEKSLVKDIETEIGKEVDLFEVVNVIALCMKVDVNNQYHIFFNSSFFLIFRSFIRSYWLFVIWTVRVINKTMMLT